MINRPATLPIAASPQVFVAALSWVINEILLAQTTHNHRLIMQHPDHQTTTEETFVVTHEANILTVVVTMTLPINNFSDPPYLSV
uniref:Uncharacterized protein n=1 Tax=Lactuca sativa TaxID=4236 RepID=A0A9R1XWU2_LACSA|nr:hypothetical protein LSAT_V11C100040290 [Lactuca sativa]